MAEKNLNVVFDTNIWISFLLGKSFPTLTNAIISNRVQILFSDELFEELFDVLQRPKFRKFFPPDIIQELSFLLNAKVTFVPITEMHNDCRDPKDNFLLDLAVSGNVDYLVTGDQDLLVLNPFKTIEIIDFKAFQKILDTSVS